VCACSLDDPDCWMRYVSPGTLHSCIPSGSSRRVIQTRFHTCQKKHTPFVFCFFGSHVTHTHVCILFFGSHVTHTFVFCFLGHMSHTHTFVFCFLGHMSHTYLLIRLAYRSTLMSNSHLEIMVQIDAGLASFLRTPIALRAAATFFSIASRPFFTA